MLKILLKEKKFALKFCNTNSKSPKNLRDNCKLKQNIMRIRKTYNLLQNIFGKVSKLVKFDKTKKL